MASILFARPTLLWFLLVIPLLIIIHFITLKSTKRRALQFANFEAIAKVTGNQILSKNFFLLFTRVSILFFVITAVSGVTVLYSGTGSEFDFVLAIDTSNSMLVQDFTPNRLESAKIAAGNFVDTVSSGNQIGIVSFSGISKKEQDLTDDYGLLKEKINQLKVNVVGGTNIGDAMITSTNLLLQSENPKVVVVLTDGQSNVGPTLQEAINYANENIVSVFTIGMGTEEGGNLFGTDAILKLDENTLKNIAANTNGEYFRAENQETLNQAYIDIAQLNQTKLSSKLTTSFLITALILLLLEWVLVNTRYRTIP